MGAVWEGDLGAPANMVDDTREIQPGDIFVLRQGAAPLKDEQIRAFCDRAVQAGAAAIVMDYDIDISVPVPIIRLSQPHLQLRKLAECFYGQPSLKMKVIAVTGTNGKTTTTYLIESLAKAMGLRVGVLGTISHRYPGYEEPSANTTPGILKLYRLMDGMAQAGCDLVVMEVSSHGIMQGRVDGVAFDAAIWNNLGTDHLDFHKTREAYALAKQRLFDHYLVESRRAGKSPIAVMNADDEEVVSHIRQACPENWGGRVASFSALGNKASIVITEKCWANGRWKLTIENDVGHVCHTELPLVGEYNLANAAGAMTAMSGIGFDLDELADALARIQQIPGRMECVCASPLVIVDFAHTPEAMENALLAVRECMKSRAGEAVGKLHVVFGAGGDRDASKRPMMGKIAQNYGDFVYVTSDNPRTENPQKIVDDIVDGISKRSGLFIDIDRENAISAAINKALPEDVVIVIGKGHEDYQILGTEKIHFDDREVCLRFLARKGAE